ncbi:MAG: FHA domain-containing protein [Planctomycetota bacterium]
MTAPLAEARTVEELARALDGQEAGEEREAIELLLDDEFQEVYPPDLRERFLARVEPSRWEQDLLRCPGCDQVLLARFLPDGGCCRRCAEPLLPRPPLELRFAAAAAPTAPAAPEARGEPELEASWELASDRSCARELDAPEEEVDFLARRAEVHQQQRARAEAAAFLGGAPAAGPAAASPAAGPAAASPAASPAATGPAATGPAAAGPAAAGPAATSPAATSAAPPAEAAAGAPGEAGPLRLEASDGEVEPFLLLPGAHVLGTARRCDLVLRARGVGFKHATVHVGADGSVEVEDLGASEGVLINGTRLPARGRAALRPGDTLALGPVSFALRGPAVALAAAAAGVPGAAAPAAGADAQAADAQAAGAQATTAATAAADAQAAPAAATAAATAAAAAAAAAAEAAAEAAAAALAAAAAAPAGAPAAPAPAEAAPPSAAPVEVAAAPTPLELREESGKREGRLHPLAPGGALELGTARSCDVVLRQRGVGYRHAIVHYYADGRCEVEDLGASGGTWVDDRQVPSKGSLPLAPGALLRCGQAELRLLGSLAPVAAARPAAPEPVQPWSPPTAAQVAAARHTDPQAILAALPADLLDLVAAASAALPLAAYLEGAARGDRPLIRRDAEDFVFLARSVLDSRWLPEPAADWVRWDPEQEQFLARSALPDGSTLILRPWELLARFAAPLPETGPRRVTLCLEELLADDCRMVPTETEELRGGFWRCRYSEAEGLLNARFEAIEARSNGHVLAATLEPRFSIDPIHHTVAEDPLLDALGRLSERTTWRPGPASLGPPAPRVPTGGRHGRDRPKPQRSRAQPR